MLITFGHKQNNHMHEQNIQYENFFKKFKVE